VRAQERRSAYARACGYHPRAHDSRARRRIASVFRGSRFWPESESSRPLTRACMQTGGCRKRAHARRAATPCPRNTTRSCLTHPRSLPPSPSPPSPHTPKASNRTNRPQNLVTPPKSPTPLVLRGHKVAVQQRTWELEMGTATPSRSTSRVLVKELQGTCTNFTKFSGWRVRKSGSATTTPNSATQPLVCLLLLSQMLACAT
jgi:hypothetical protein